MRHLAWLLLLSPALAFGQAYTSVTSSALKVDNGSGTAVYPPSRADVCFSGVNNLGTAITYTPSGGSPVSTPVCQTLNSTGGLTGRLQVANPATATSAALFYTITVTSGGTTYLSLPIVSLSGSIFALDTYALPSTGAALGVGFPHLGCSDGAQWTSNTLSPGNYPTLCQFGHWSQQNLCPAGTAQVQPATGKPFCIAPTFNGAGAPTGYCVQGSFYQQTDSPGTIFPCVNGAWSTVPAGSSCGGGSPCNIAQGGTNAATASAPLANLGAFPSVGGTINGPVGYGYSCASGVTDSSSCLRSAIAANPEIKLTPGTWNLANEWTVAVGTVGTVKICGSGPQTILNITGANGGIHVTGTAGSTSAKLLLCDMTVQSSSSRGTFGVHLDGIGQFHVQNVNVQLLGSGALTNCYQVTGSQQGEIDGGQLSGCTNAMKFEASGGVHSNGVEVHGMWLVPPAGGTGFNIANTDDAFIHSNHIVFPGTGACLSDSGGGYGVINYYDNHCEGYSSGIVAGGDDLATQNSFYPATSGGVRVGNDATVTGYLKLNFNLLQGPVVFQSGSEGTFIGNTMELYSSFTDNHAGGNTIQRCANFGVTGSSVGCNISSAAASRGVLFGGTPSLSSVVPGDIYSPFLLTFNGSLSGITAVASTFTCSVNPVFTLDDCGSSVSGCGSASGIASVTLTAGNAVTIGTIASASLRCV